MKMMLRIDAKLRRLRLPRSALSSRSSALRSAAHSHFAVLSVLPLPRTNLLGRRIIEEDRIWTVYRFRLPSRLRLIL